MMFVMFALGNIIGPQVFRATDSPRYHNAFAAHIALYGKPRFELPYWGLTSTDLSVFHGRLDRSSDHAHEEEREEAQGLWRSGFRKYDSCTLILYHKTWLRAAYLRPAKRSRTTMRSPT